MPESWELLRTQINDEHPRVRLEAIRALSFFEGDDAGKAQEIALELLQSPLDYYLEYTLNETNKTLDRRATEIRGWLGVEDAWRIIDEANERGAQVSSGAAQATADPGTWR